MYLQVLQSDAPALILIVLRIGPSCTLCQDTLVHAVSPLLPLQRVANRLGLQHHPLRGAAVAPIMFGGHSAPVRALTEPLTVQLLAGPGNIAFQITIPVVLVVPSRPEGDQIELQLGLFDFCQEVQFDFLPLWASQFTHVPTGYSWALPVIAPQQRSHYIRTAGTSTFHITHECYDEVGGGPGRGLGVTAGCCRCTARILLPWVHCTANACHLLLSWVYCIGNPWCILPMGTLPMGCRCAARILSILPNMSIFYVNLLPRWWS
mgnify:CR=1 FL=1